MMNFNARTVYFAYVGVVLLAIIIGFSILINQGLGRQQFLLFVVFSCATIPAILMFGDAAKKPDGVTTYKKQARVISAIVIALAIAAWSMS
jgi:hypothetical protein